MTIDEPESHLPHLRNKRTCRNPFTSLLKSVQVARREGKARWSEDPGCSHMVVSQFPLAQPQVSAELFNPLQMDKMTLARFSTD